jgi:hypothetical protein
MNYSEIKDLALSYSDREDNEVINNLDNFLRMVESRINRKLKTMDMSVRASIETTGDSYYGLPSDFGRLRDIEYRQDNKVCTLKYMSPEQLNNHQNLSVVSQVGAQIYYTLINKQIQVSTPPDEDAGTIEIVYYQKIVALDATNTTNWMSSDNPDVYLCGLMVEISSFVKNAEAKLLWDDRFVEAIAEIDLDDSISRWSGTSLQTKIG